MIPQCPQLLKVMSARGSKGEPLIAGDSKDYQGWTPALTCLRSDTHTPVQRPICKVFCDMQDLDRYQQCTCLWAPGVRVSVLLTSWGETQSGLDSSRGAHSSCSALPYGSSMKWPCTEETKVFVRIWVLAVQGLLGNAQPWWHWASPVGG